MVKRSIGLRGYVGEHIFEYVLNIKYNGCKIIKQLIPIGSNITGGGYLDFGVIDKNDKLIAVYEVKSQDVVANQNFPVNKAIKYIWEHNEEILRFKVQEEKNDIEAIKNVPAYLILLSPGNDKFFNLINLIGDKNKKNIKLFSDLIEEQKINYNLDNQKIYDYIFNELKKDLKSEINLIFSPKSGKTLLRDFNNWRNNK